MASDFDHVGYGPDFRMMLRRVQIIHAALFAGMLMMLGSMVMLRFLGGMEAVVAGSAATILLLAVLVYSCLIVLGDGLLTRWRIGRLRATPRERRPGLYLTLAIIRCALLESVLIAALTAWMLARNDALILIGAIAIAAMLFAWPTEERVQKELQSAEEMG